MVIKLGKWKWRPGFSAAQRRMQRRIADAVQEWLEQKGYTRNLSTLEEVAADIGVPSDQLSLYIRMKTRRSVLVWRKELRIREACQLLLDFPDLPISAIGEMVGVDDKSNFRRQFRQSMGMQPRAWRERHVKRTDRRSGEI